MFKKIKKYYNDKRNRKAYCDYLRSEFPLEYKFQCDSKGLCCPPELMGMR